MRMASIRRVVTTIVQPWLGFGIVLLCWWLLADTEWASRKPQIMWLAHPRDVLAKLFHLSSYDWDSIVATTLRIIPGFFLVFLFGIPAGLILGYLTDIYRVAEGTL